MITHATIMGIVEVYTTSGKCMQSWVYLTLPEVKPTQKQWRSYQEISKFLHHWTEKTRALSFLVHPSFDPSNSPKRQMDPKPCAVSEEGSGHHHLWTEPANTKKSVASDLCWITHYTVRTKQKTELSNMFPWSITPSLNYTHQKQRRELGR